MLKSNGRSFFSVPREHGPPVGFFLAYRVETALSRRWFFFRTQFQAHELQLYTIMVKRKAEKQQPAGKFFFSFIFCNITLKLT